MLRNGNKRQASKMSEAQQRKIEAALEKVFRDHNEEAGPASRDRRTHDFIFHMTDWYGDLLRLAKVMEHPEGKSDHEWDDAVYGFLIHVSGHLTTAAKIADIEPVQFEIPIAKSKPRRAATASR